MNPFYYCGTCGAPVDFKFGHSCAVRCLVCRNPVDTALSGAVKVNEGWMHDCCRDWDAAGRPPQ